MKRDLFVIVNPAAGGGHAGRYRPAVADYFAARGRLVDFVDSCAAGEVRELAAQAASAGYSCVLALGGDGTFHDVIEGVRETNALAGLLPAGNGNDAARALGISRDPIRAADDFLHSRPRAIDLIRARFADGRIVHCVCTAGVGLDAEAAHLANTRFRAWPGVSRYLAGAIWTYFHGATFDLHVEIDGAPWYGRSLLAVVANAPEYGAGIRIAPSAKIDDGWLDLLLARELPWPRFVEAIPILLTSGDIRFEEIERFRCKRVRFAPSRAMRVHGDGEIIGEIAGGSSVEFEIAPAAVRVMAPPIRE
jgi:diacylglycerol kinase (ATP)